MEITCGLVTTRTAEPEPDALSEIGSAATGSVLAFLVKVSVWGAVLVPSDSSQ